MTTFGYDGLGRRVKQTYVNGTTTNTRYLWCGSSLCQIRDGSDVVTTRLFAEGEYRSSDAKKYLYLTDHLGSVRDVVDITGTPTLVGSFDYTPYGAVARSWGTVTPVYQFAMLQADANTGLDLSVTRAYNPANGKWLNVDPIRETGGINLYGYGGGDPAWNIDPLGLCSPLEKAAIKAAADILGGALGGCIGGAMTGAAAGAVAGAGVGFLPGGVAGCITGAIVGASIGVAASVLVPIVGAAIGGAAEALQPVGGGLAEGSLEGPFKGEHVEPGGIVRGAVGGVLKLGLKQPIEAIAPPLNALVAGIGGAVLAGGFVAPQAAFGGFVGGAAAQAIEDGLNAITGCNCESEKKE